MDKLAYVMSPYTHKCPALMATRAAEAAYFLSHLVTYSKYQDYILYSPIVHWHYVAVHNDRLPRDADFWWRLNKPYLDQASLGIVLQISGWNRSSGIAQETHYLVDRKVKILHEEIDGWIKKSFTYTPPK